MTWLIWPTMALLGVEMVATGAAASGAAFFAAGFLGAFALGASVAMSVSLPTIF
jgi:hypothetical protein